MIDHITWGAMVVLWTMLSSSSLTMVELTLRKITLTRAEMALAIPSGFVLNCFVCFIFCNQHPNLTLLVEQKNAKAVTIDGYEDVPENDESSLKKAVANQPVSVAIEAGGRAFQLYQSVISLTLNNFLNVASKIYGFDISDLGNLICFEFLFEHHILLCVELFGKPFQVKPFLSTSNLSLCIIHGVVSCLGVFFKSYIIQGSVCVFFKTIIVRCGVRLF